MKIPVMVYTYPTERYELFSEIVGSALAQAYRSLELVIVIDKNEEGFDRMQDGFGDINDTVPHYNDENRSISYSRTKGTEPGTGGVVAMVDDDTTAGPDWIETLVDTYESNSDAVAVGGTVVSDWAVRKPELFPEEFYWLVECDERGLGEHMEEVRSIYGSDISFKRNIFLEMGGYDTSTGQKGDKHIQAHEAPICIRIHEQTGERVIYNKQACVNHKLFEHRTESDRFVFRSFWQDYSRRVTDLLYPRASGDKNAHPKDLMLVYAIDQLKNLAEDPPLVQVQQLTAIFASTAVVGFGYVYGLLTPNLVKKTNN